MTVSGQFRPDTSFLWIHLQLLFPPSLILSSGNHEYCYQGVTNTSKVDISGAPLNGWHPSWGNMNVDSRGECGVPLYHRWRAPDTGNAVFWYSFNYGPLTVIQLGSEHDWTPGSRQYMWFEKTLSAIDRKVTPFVFVTIHRMMYTTQLCEDSDYKISFYLREALEPLLRKYRVNAMLVGHQHSYERSCPVLQGKCIPQPNHNSLNISTATSSSSSSSTSSSSSSSSSSLSGTPLLSEETRRYLQSLPLTESQLLARHHGSTKATKHTFTANLDDRNNDNANDSKDAGKGHVFISQRHVGLDDVISKGTVHVTVGSAGAGLEKCGFSPDLGEWTVSATNSWGIMRASVTAERAVLEFVRNVNNDVYDRIVMVPWVEDD